MANSRSPDPGPSLNLRSIDLNLLTVFEVVYQERNQAEAAKRLAMTQPAVSNALARLRQAVKDKLFVAARRGVNPTDGADQLYAQVHPALEAIRQGIGQSRKFDPATSRRLFRIGLVYGGGVFLAAHWARAVRREAPNISIAVRMVDDVSNLSAQLRDGRLDVAVDYVKGAGDGLESRRVAEDRLRLIARRDHPRIRAHPTLKQALAEEYVVSSEVFQAAKRLDDIAQVLKKIMPRIAVEVPVAAALMSVVSLTDLVSVVPEGLARPVATGRGLNLFDSPFRVPSVSYYLVWHRVRETDSGHAWLRSKLIEIARQFPTRAAR